MTVPDDLVERGALLMRDKMWARPGEQNYLKPDDDALSVAWFHDEIDIPSVARELILETLRGIRERDDNDYARMSIKALKQAGASNAVEMSSCARYHLSMLDQLIKEIEANGS